MCTRVRQKIVPVWSEKAHTQAIRVALPSSAAVFKLDRSRTYVTDKTLTKKKIESKQQKFHLGNSVRHIDVYVVRESQASTLSLPRSSDRAVLDATVAVRMPTTHPIAALAR